MTTADREIEESDEPAATRGSSSGEPIVERNLDGSTTEYFDVRPSAEDYAALVRAVFEEHWDQVDFGPCIQGAVFELRFATKPRVSFLDGYFTIGEEGEGRSHFHLCTGEHKGTKARPTPPDLATWRRCARASFYVDRDPSGRASSWGLRFWNGRAEQMMSIFFPNPWLNASRTKLVKDPDWTRLTIWMELRRRFTGVAIEPPPASPAPRPAMH